ncbi:hypothetical protein [Streptomyces lunaelactis]|uniref:hypothetical protein n=1 Tax=Streptomyces lunaelactis TaxID=1535768 RepID=UPI0015857891|nr:hypothetical protein [Streptomyces lunaelactis]NUK14030.1 hypothetical protein [Streptomyces lunaelactis]
MVIGNSGTGGASTTISEEQRREMVELLDYLAALGTKMTVRAEAVVAGLHED